MSDLRTIFHDILAGDAEKPYLVSAWQHLIGHEYGADEFAAAGTILPVHPVGRTM